MKYRKDFEYDLFMRTDYGTSGFTQWFYYRISNTRKGQSYKFNILNMLKPDFLYNQGMKILIYSNKDANENSFGWKRDGSSIAYYKNAIQHRPGFNFYTLTFTITAKCTKAN
jgi:hypothetical protein